jgi:pSer/pThr/pTyr-binding forkhead associated (FHA) protein
MQHQLIIADDDGATTIVPLGPDVVTIGRQEGNTIQLTEQNVSRRHAKLYPDGEGWVIEDLRSYNGVQVNGVAIEGRVVLDEGDLVKIGDYQLVLTTDADRRTLNLDGGEAANDAEPVAARSSSDLPRIVPEGGIEAHEAHGDFLAPTAAAAAVEAVEDHGVERLVIERRGGVTRPLVVVLGIATLGLVAMALAVFGRGGGKSSERVAKAPDTAASVSAQQTTAPPPPQLGTTAPTASAPQLPSALPPAAGTQEEAPPSPGATKTGGPAPPPATEPAVDTPEPEPEPVERRRKRAPKPPRPPAVEEPRARPEPEPTPAPPPPEPEPMADPDQLLKDARKASLLGNAAQAYKLASQSHSIRPNQNALEVMGVAACKMGDAAKARSAYRRLTGSRRDELAALCASKGINLE